MFSEDDLIPISALQHFLFCERQCALIHLEQIWTENRFTAEGTVLHERVDVEHRERRKNHRTEYSMALRSLELGLVGVADVVEVTLRPDGGYQSVVPVEYKRGTKKSTEVDNVQLCAQALCLESMLGVSVPFGEFYYLQDHRRTEVDFGEPLRSLTKATVARTRELFETRLTPPAVFSKDKCERCSLVEVCMPRWASGARRTVAEYMAQEVSRGRQHA